MDTNNINISVLEQSYSTLQSEKSNFRNTTYSTFKSSYIYNCNDDLVRRLKKNLDSCYDHIEDEYRNITRWFEYYLDDVKRVDHGIVNGLNFINTHENAIQGYYSTHLTPLTLDYNKIHSKIQLSTVSFSNTPFLNNGTSVIIGNSNSLMSNSLFNKSSLFNKNNYTSKVTSGNSSKVDSGVVKNTQEKSFWGQVWEGVVDLGVLMTHAATQMMNGSADALPTIQSMENNYNSMMNTKKLVDLDDTAKAIGVEKDGVIATVGTFFTSIGEAVLKMGEFLQDASKLYGFAEYSINNSEPWKVEEKKVIELMKADTMAFVSEDKTGTLFNEFYENDGKWLKENAYYFDEVRTAGNFVGQIGGNVLLSAPLTPLAPIIPWLMPGLIGLGAGAETAWQDGASFEEGMAVAGLTGAVEGGSYGFGMAINNLNPFKKEAFNAILHIVLDAVDGATNALANNATSIIYQDGYNDSNGVYYEYSDNFLTAYMQAFAANGGLINVLTNALVGAGFSFFGEVSGFAKYLRDKVLGKVDVETDVLNKEAAKGFKNLLTDEYQVKWDQFLDNVTNIKNSATNSVKEGFEKVSSKVDEIKNKVKDVNVKNDETIENLLEKTNPVDEVHGFQLTIDDLGEFYQKKLQQGFFTKEILEGIVSKINCVGYMDESLGKYLKGLFNGENDIYIKTVNSTDVESINAEGIRCLDTSTSACIDTTGKISLENTVTKVTDGGLSELVQRLKSANGLSQGRNPIDGAVILSIPKNKSIEDILKYNDELNLYNIDPVYNKMFISCDENGTLKLSEDCISMADITSLIGTASREDFLSDNWSPERLKMFLIQKFGNIYDELTINSIIDTIHMVDSSHWQSLLLERGLNSNTAGFVDSAHNLYLPSNANMHTAVHETLHKLSELRNQTFESNGQIYKVTGIRDGHGNVRGSNWANEILTEYLSSKQYDGKFYASIYDDRGTFVAVWERLDKVLEHQYGENSDILLRTYLNNDTKFLKSFFEYCDKNASYDDFINALFSYNAPGAQKILDIIEKKVYKKSFFESILKIFSS